jgi:hypothetical protein
MEWTEFKTKITAWKRANKGWDDAESPNYEVDLVSLNNVLAKGKDESRQKRLMTTIRFFFSDVASNPFRTGKASTMDSALLADYNSGRPTAREDLITLFKTDFFKKYAVKSKRGGGGVFLTPEAAADYELASIDARVHSAIRGSSKDYEYVKGKPLKNLIVQKVVATPEAPTKTE